MTLKEITDLLNVRHDKSKIKVEKMAEDQSFGPMSKMDISYQAGNGAVSTIETYVLDKRQSIAVAARLNTALLMRVIDRWQELEAKLALPDFTNPVDAARAFIKQYEEKIEAEKERDEAIATKSWIGSHREASAMGKASAATRKVEKLEKQLGLAKNWKTVKAIPWLLDVFINNSTTYQQVGRKLTALSVDPYEKPKQVPDSKFGEVKAYHIDVIRELKRRLENDPEFMAKYRIKEKI